MNLPTETLYAVRGMDLQRMLAQFRFNPKAIAADRGERKGPMAPKGTALVQLVGVLEKRLSFFGWLFGGTDMMHAREQVLRAAANDAVGSIMLYVDSPGGSVAGTGDLADAVRAARDRKPVYAYISDLGASAAYYVASQATAVYANPTALVGSIGTYGVIQDWSGAFEQAGVKVHVIKAGEFKGTGQPGTEVTDEQLAELQRVVDAQNREFIKAVSLGRKMPMDRARGLADGRVHIGNEAVKLGLIDGIQTFEQTLADVERLPAPPAVVALRAEAKADSANRKREFERMKWRRERGYTV